MHCQRVRKGVPLDEPLQKRGQGQYEVEALPKGEVYGCVVSILLWPYQAGHLQGLLQSRGQERTA